MHPRHRLLLACLALAAMVAWTHLWTHFSSRRPLPKAEDPSGARTKAAAASASILASPPADPEPRTSPAAAPTGPSVADEEALLQLLENAKHEAAPAVRHERLVAICQRWAGFDPPAAIALALESKLDPLEGALLPNLAQQWAARDFDAAQAWAEKLSPGDLRDQVYSRLIYEKALADPAAAARLLALMRAAGSARDEATVTVVHAWAQRDLSGARAWVRAFADGPVRERYLAELAARARSSARGGAGATDAIRD